MQDQPADLSITWPDLPVREFGEILEQAPYALAALWAKGSLDRLLALERVREALAVIDRHVDEASSQWALALEDRARCFDLHLVVPRPVATAWLAVLTRMCELGHEPHAMVEVGGRPLDGATAGTALAMLEHARRSLGGSS